VHVVGIQQSLLLVHLKHVLQQGATLGIFEETLAVLGHNEAVLVDYAMVFPEAGGGLR
jgi:hypothetical protein